MEERRSFFSYGSSCMNGSCYRMNYVSNVQIFVFLIIKGRKGEHCFKTNMEDER